MDYLAQVAMEVTTLSLLLGHRTAAAVVVVRLEIMEALLAVAAAGNFGGVMLALAVVAVAVPLGREHLHLQEGLVAAGQ
jgi:ABC-type uncharacterized transport system permease subunit